MATEQTRAMEAILMVAEGPVEPQLLAQLLEMDVTAVEAQLRELMASYEVEDRGFILTKVAGGYRYQSHPDLAHYVERFVLEGQSARLSAAALETLAIIAYKQPISRGQVAAIRGVSVDGVIRTLEQRGYITEVGRDPGPGNPSLFGTTVVFLEKLGLNSIDELPPIADFVPGPDVVEQLEQGLRAEIDTDPELAVEADEGAADEATSAENTASEPAAEGLVDEVAGTREDTVVDLTDGVTVEIDPAELLEAADEGAVVAMDAGEAAVLDDEDAVVEPEAEQEVAVEPDRPAQAQGEPEPEVESEGAAEHDDHDELVVETSPAAAEPEPVAAFPGTSAAEPVDEGSTAAVPADADEPVEAEEPDDDPEEPVEVTTPAADPDEPVEAAGADAATVVRPDAPADRTDHPTGGSPTTVAGLIAGGGPPPVPAPAEPEVAPRPFRDDGSVLGAPAFGSRPVGPDQDEVRRSAGGGALAGRAAAERSDVDAHAERRTGDHEVDAGGDRAGAPGGRSGDGAEVIDLAARRATSSSRIDAEEAGDHVDAQATPHTRGGYVDPTTTGPGEAGRVPDADGGGGADAGPGEQGAGGGAAAPMVGEAPQPDELTRDDDDAR